MRSDGFNIYRTADYVARLPQAKVRQAGRGCGRLIAKTAPTAQSCAAAAAAAGSLPFFAWSDASAFCFACADAVEGSAPAPGYDIYAAEDFPLGFEEVKGWMQTVKPLELWREADSSRLSARARAHARSQCSAAPARRMGGSGRLARAHPPHSPLLRRAQALGASRASSGRCGRHRARSSQG